MSSTFSFSGIASGLQWRDMIDQIIKLESRPIAQVQSRISNLDARSGAWATFRSRVETLMDAAETLRSGTAFRAFTTSIAGTAPGQPAPLRATASGDAVPGTHTIRVLGLAAAEKLSGAVVSSRTEALGLSGEFLVGGARIAVEETDSLDTIVAKINAANTGRNASGVTATILSTAGDAHRLVLTADRTGAAGIDLVDGASGILRALGILEEETSLKHATSNGARSDAFTDADTAVATLRGFTAPVAGTVSFGTGASRFDVALDLATMSLADVAAAINAAADGAGSSVQARVVEETVDDETIARLEISGTTTFGDQGRVLEALGVLEGGRGAVAQTIQGGVLTAGDAATPATATTRLTDLWVNGQAAGVQAGDTISITGTRADGSTVEITYTVTGTDTLQDFLDRLNDATDGFGAGSRTATARISEDGRLTLVDDQGGDSRLSLSIVAHNEGGGTLDFGAMTTVQAGRARVVTRGADAELEIDGTYLRRAQNTISDVIPGLSLTLSAAAPETTLTLAVSREDSAAVAAVKAFVDAFNQVTDFVKSQVPSGVEGAATPPLAGDSVLRSMHLSLRAAFQTTLAAGVAGDFTRLADIGIEIDKAGRFTFDAAAFQAALASDPTAVERLFGAFVETSAPGVEYVTHGSMTRAGTYDVHITQAAERAAVVGAGFGGVYVDDGVPDMLTVRDLDSNRTYSVELTNGMTMAEIVAALNEEFATATRHTLAASVPLFADADGTTRATEATTFAELFRGDGTGAGIADGTMFTISGRRANGESFVSNFTVEDAETQTLGSLVQAIRAEFGPGVDVAIEDGVLTARSTETGASLLEFAISAEGAVDEHPFGAIETVVQGRAPARITAIDDGGQLRIEHEAYGSTAGFEISFTAGGEDGSASLGIAAGTYTGLDVQGTIGGFAATGTGTTLTGAEGSPVEGLLIRYAGSDTGEMGTVTVSLGAAEELVRIAERLTRPGPGSIQDVVDSIDTRVASMHDRIREMEDRLERRREMLVRQFAAMEQALAAAQAQSQWLMSQLAALGGQTGSF